MGGGGDEAKPVPFGVGLHRRLYQEIYGGDKGVGAEVLERVNDRLFPVRPFVLVKEISRVIRLHWC